MTQSQGIGELGPVWLCFDLAQNGLIVVIVRDPIFRQVHFNPFYVFCDLWAGLLGSKTRNHSVVALPASDLQTS